MAIIMEDGVERIFVPGDKLPSQSSHFLLPFRSSFPLRSYSALVRDARGRKLTLVRCCSILGEIIEITIPLFSFRSCNHISIVQPSFAAPSALSALDRTMRKTTNRQKKIQFQFPLLSLRHPSAKSSRHSFEVVRDEIPPKQRSPLYLRPTNSTHLPLGRNLFPRRLHLSRALYSTHQSSPRDSRLFPPARISQQARRGRVERGELWIWGWIR